MLCYGDFYKNNYKNLVLSLNLLFSYVYKCRFCDSSAKRTRIFFENEGNKVV